MSVHILPDPVPMSPAHQRLRAALHRLDQAERAGLAHPRLRVTQPVLTHPHNGGHVARVHRYSTRTEAVIVKIAQKKARRDQHREWAETLLAVVLLILGVLAVLAALTNLAAIAVP